MVVLDQMDEILENRFMQRVKKKKDLKGPEISDERVKARAMERSHRTTFGRSPLK